MAYRRSILTTVSHLRQRVHPSFTYILHVDDDKYKPKDADAPQFQNHYILQRGYHSSIRSASGLSSLLRRKNHSYFLPTHGLLSCNYSSEAIGEGVDKMEYIKDVTEILTEKGVEVASQIPAASEVAIAAADSYFPVAALQYMIDGVHSFTGLNWWASIVLTTIMIRGATIPLSINQLKATSKIALMKPELEEIKQRMQDMAMDPKAVSEGQQQMSALFKRHGVTPFTPLKGLFIQGPIFISFFLAISNMAEKVPSFKQGGAFWFTDLTTPDSLYIFPVLTALTFLITVESNMQEGMEGNPMAGTMKTFSRIVGVLTVPFTMAFPKAIFCYWITSNFFSLMYGIVITRPDVKKALNLPDFAATTTTTTTSTSNSKPASLDLISAFKTSISSDDSVSKESDQKISSSSVIRQRLKTLEKQVKGRKKN